MYTSAVSSVQLVYFHRTETYPSNESSFPSVLVLYLERNCKFANGIKFFGTFSASMTRFVTDNETSSIFLNYGRIAIKSIS